MKEFEYGTDEFFYYQRLPKKNVGKKGAPVILKIMLFFPFFIAGYFIADLILPARKHDGLFWGKAVFVAIMMIVIIRNISRCLFGR
jgi:hypothetical protein